MVIIPQWGMKEDIFMKFIDGVILIEEIYRFPTIFLIILWVIIASGLWICLDLARNMSKKKPKVVILEFIIVAILAFATYEFIIDPLNFEKPTGEYRVSTTQYVNMTEFQDTYEIVDYKDGVYTIKPQKNTNEN